MSELHLPLASIGRVRGLFLAASGTNRAVLDQCPTEVEARTGLGVAVVVPTLLAGVGGAVALSNLGAPDPLIVGGALVVAGIVGAVDRLMVTSPVGWASMALRAVMTLALAWLIGEQLLIAAFASEIDAEVAAVHAERVEVTTAQVNAAADAELRRIDARLAELGIVDGEISAARAGLEEAEAEVAERLAVLEGLKVELSAEITGVSSVGGSGRAGDGPAAEAKRAEISVAQIAFDEATGRRDRAVERVEALAAGSQPDEDADVAEIAELRAQRLVVEDDRGDSLDAAAVTIGGADGIIARVEGLERLARTPLVAAQVWSLRFLLLAIDTLPLTSKLAYVHRSRRPYEELVAAHQETELRRARRIVDDVDEVDEPASVGRDVVVEEDLVSTVPDRRAQGDETRGVPAGRHHPRGLFGDRVVSIEPGTIAARSLSSVNGSQPPLNGSDPTSGTA